MLVSKRELRGRCCLQFPERLSRLPRAWCWEMKFAGEAVNDSQQLSTYSSHSFAGLGRDRLPRAAFWSLSCSRRHRAGATRCIANPAASARTANWPGDREDLFKRLEEHGSSAGAEPSRPD